MFEPIPLTAAEIRRADELAADRIANDETLNVALQFHSNRCNEMYKVGKKLWDDLAEAHEFFYQGNPNLIIDRHEGQVCIVEQVSKKKELA